MPAVEVGEPGREVACGGVAGLPVRILAEQIAGQVRRRLHPQALLVAHCFPGHWYTGERGMALEHDERVDDAAVGRPAGHDITSSMLTTL